MYNNSTVGGAESLDEQTIFETDEQTQMTAMDMSTLMCFHLASFWVIAENAQRLILLDLSH